MIRKREPRWQSAAERARVASDLIEEAESLTETNTSASSADGRRDSLPPQAELHPGRATTWYHLGNALNRANDLHGALAAFERAVELEPGNGKALYGLGIVLDRLNRPDEATLVYRRSRETGGR